MSVSIWIVYYLLLAMIATARSSSYIYMYNFAKSITIEYLNDSESMNEVNVYLYLARPLSFLSLALDVCYFLRKVG